MSETATIRVARITRAKTRTGTTAISDSRVTGRLALFAIVLCCVFSFSTGRAAEVPPAVTSPGDERRDDASLANSAPKTDGFVPFVIPGRMSPNSVLVAPSIPIPPDGPRVIIENAHFVRDGRQFRAWGVNLAFGANLPDEADAREAAVRLAGAGINAVRIHHLDTNNFPEGIWNKDGKTISTAALKRFDFFIDQLARKGIVADLNLHVGHAFSRDLGLPKPNTNYDKIVDLFVPEIIAAQKRYARELLTHVNPYRGLRYAEDPEIAFVEISNEDSFFMWNGDKKLRSLPSYYSRILQSQFDSWLKRRYTDTKGLRAAWDAGASSLGKNVLVNGDFQKRANAGRVVPPSWVLEQHGAAKAETKTGEFDGVHGLWIQPVKLDDTDWHLQLGQRDLKLEGEHFYTVSYRARADSPRSIQCVVGMAHDPWKDLGFRRDVDLTTEWKSYRLGFLAPMSDNQARVSISFGGSKAAWYLADVELRPGGRTGLAKGERLEDGSVALYGESETTRRSLDRLEFLGETEKAYYDGMRQFIHDDLGYKGLVTGTIVFSPLGLYAQSDMDYLDGHAYWQHPSFPGRPWDPVNWLIRQRAMTDHPEQATLFQLAMERVAGKPFTVSEYNHPAPNDYQEECVPMLASYAAAQGWDGVWFYAYKHGHESWNTDSFDNFFDLHANSSKWGFMRAGAAMFRDAGIAPFRDAASYDLTGGRAAFPALANLELGFSPARLRTRMALEGVTPDTFLKKRIYEVLGAGAGARPSLPTERADAESTRVFWNVNSGGKGGYFVRGGGGWVFSGHREMANASTDGTVQLKAPDFAAIVFTSLDGAPLATCRKALVAACGRSENMGMVFAKDRRTVGRNWGHGPVQIEAVDGVVSLPPGHWRCQALGPDGSAKINVPIEPGRAGSDHQQLRMSHNYATMWYFLTRE